MAETSSLKRELTREEQDFLAGEISRMSLKMINAMTRMVPAGAKVLPAEWIIRCVAWGVLDLWREGREIKLDGDGNGRDANSHQADQLDVADAGPEGSRQA